VTPGFPEGRAWTPIICPGPGPGENCGRDPFKYSEKAYWSGDDPPYTHAHEFGHLLGFHDQYDKNGAYSGYEDTIMGGRGGTPGNKITAGQYKGMTYRDLVYGRFNQPGSSFKMTADPSQHP
jgi:hypothetical protein